MSDDRLRKLIETTTELLKSTAGSLSRIDQDHGALRREIAEVRRRLDRIEKQGAGSEPLRKLWDGIHDAPLRLQ